MKVNEKLVELLKEVKEVDAMARLELANWPFPETRAGAEASKAIAKQKLPRC